MIFYSNGDNLENRMQGEKRPHREGQTRPVTCVDFTTEGTLEPKKVRALRSKIDIAAQINGDNWREWVV
jgi:SNF2 family DNA or RNA helicase